MARNPKPNIQDATFTVRLSKADLKALQAIKVKTGKSVSVLLRNALQFIIFSEIPTIPANGGAVRANTPQKTGCIQR